MFPTDRDPTGEATVVVADHDALDDVLDRVWLLAGRSVRLGVPPGSSLFMTAGEFRVLREVAARRQIGLTVLSEDPLRVQLAGMFGLPAVRVGGPLGPRLLEPPARPEPAPEAGNGHVAGYDRDVLLPDLPYTVDGELPSAAANGVVPFPGGRDADAATGPRFREPGQPFTLRPADDWQALDVAPRAPTPDLPPPVPESPPAPVRAPAIASNSAGLAPSASGPTGIAPPSVDAGRPSDSPNLARLPAAPPVPQPGERFRALREAAARRAARERGALLRRSAIAAVAAGALLVALVALALFVVLPRATVTVRLKEQTIVAETPFRVLPPGETAGPDELAVPGEAVNVEVAFTASAETTGTAMLGVTPAAGTVQLANPGDEAVTIPAGTTGTSDTGAQFRFTEEVAVPAAADGAGGLAEAAIEMVEPGTAGNLDVGELSGLLESGVYFSNRMSPLEGGTDREARGVAQTDLDALQAKFEQELGSLAEAQFRETLPAGLAVAANSFAFGEPDLVFDRGVGEAGETVTLTANVAVEALAFRPEQVMAEVEPSLRAALEDKVPEGFELDPTAVTFSAPESVGDADADGANVVVTASGRAVARFTDEERTALADRLEGKSAGEAAEVLGTVPAIDGFGVDYFPGLLFERMPRSADRIEIVVPD